MKNNQIANNIRHYIRLGFRSVEQVASRFGLIKDSAGRVYTADPKGRRLIGYHKPGMVDGAQ